MATNTTAVQSCQRVTEIELWHEDLSLFHFLDQRQVRFPTVGRHLRDLSEKLRTPLIEGDSAGLQSLRCEPAGQFAEVDRLGVIQMVDPAKVFGVFGKMN